MAEVSPLRFAGPGEADAIAALIRLAFSTQSVATEPPPSARLETGETVGGHFAAGGGGAVAGDFHAAALWMLEGEGFHVRRLSVHPDFRRRGLARLLLQYAEDQARMLGAARIHLSTRLPLIDNRKLFAACGFVETTLHAHPGYAAPTYVDLEKRLR